MALDAAPTAPAAGEQTVAPVESVETAKPAAAAPETKAAEAQAADASQDSLRAEQMALAKKLLSDEPEAPATDAEAPAEGETDEAKAAAAEKKLVQKKDEKGRFTSEKVEAEVKAEADVDGAAPEAATEPKIPPPSQHYDKQLWAKLPKEAQTFLSDRERNIQSFASDIGRRLKSAMDYSRPYAELEENYAPLLQRLGTDMKGAVNNVLAFQQRWEADAIGETANLIKGYAEGARIDPRIAAVSVLSRLGIDLTQLALDAPNPLSAPDPEVAKLRSERDAHAAAIARREREEQYQREAQTQQQETEFRNHVTQYAADKPYWSLIEKDVSAHMPAIWQQYPDADPRAVLQEAHDRAVWSNPQTRSILIKAQADAEAKAAQSAAEAKRAEDARKRATSAKRIAVLNSSGTDQLPPGVEPDLRTAQRKLLASMGIQ